jgi:hypothetical protein
MNFFTLTERTTRKHGMIVYNIYTILVLAVSVLCGCFGWWATESQTVVMFASGGGAAACDLLLRLKVMGKDGLLSPAAGGHIWFIPAWMLGVAWIGLTVAIALGFIK